MRRTFSLLAAAAVLTSAGCGDAPTDPGSLVGNYNLVSINGAPPPIVIQQGPGYRLDLLSSSVELRSDQSYTITSLLRETVQGAAEDYAEVLDGTWSTTSRTVILRDDEGFTTHAVIEGSTLVLDQQGVRLVFQR